MRRPESGRLPTTATTWNSGASSSCMAIKHAAGRRKLAAAAALRVFEPRRGVAQPGRAAALGAVGRRFESSHPDQHGPAVRVMVARIYRPAKTAMQSGRALTRAWVLEFAPAERKENDPLMGWVGSGDTEQQVRLFFDTK